MVNDKIRGVEFIAINTDAQDLRYAQAQTKIHIGKNITRGLGAGMTRISASRRRKNRAKKYKKC